LRHLSNPVFLNYFLKTAPGLCDKPDALPKYRRAILFLNSTIFRRSQLVSGLLKRLGRKCLVTERKNSLSSQGQPRDEYEVIRGILQQCIKYPDRKDTIEGILKWWLPEGRAEWRKEDVQKVLDLLTSKGWLTKRQQPHQKNFTGSIKIDCKRLEVFFGNLAQAVNGLSQCSSTKSQNKEHIQKSSVMDPL
jgi:hypothetical protein